ncbi:MAG: Tol-Pal system beta propeller repeat protein TolB [Burkholderiales bacterium]
MIFKFRGHASPGARLRGALSKIIFLLLMLCATPSRAALTIEIIGGGATQIPVAVVPFAAEQGLPQSITTVIGADLARSGLFKLVDTGGIVPLPVEPADIRYGDWKARGADAIVIGSVKLLPEARIEVRFRLMDAAKQVQLAGFSYIITSAQLRLTAHRIADVVYEKLTGDPGVFSTQISYVVKQGNRYELQIADADGYGAQTIVTSNDSIISSAWSPDGGRLAYVSFEKKHAVTYIQSLQTGKRTLLAGFEGSNSAPAWAPDGKRLAIVLTKDGSSQIYMINADGGGLQRLTFSSAIDTEPNFSKDGKWIVFTSDRGGSPQIYRMPANGGDAERLTFEGTYNVSPRFSPDGKSFVFIQRAGGRFNIAVQDLATRQAQVLTDSNLDESPTYAPNGKIILYATETGGRGVLAAVSNDGKVKQRLTVQSGDVREPSWGPFKTQ